MKLNEILLEMTDLIDRFMTDIGIANSEVEDQYKKIINFLRMNCNYYVDDFRSISNRFFHASFDIAMILEKLFNVDSSEYLPPYKKPDVAQYSLKLSLDSGKKEYALLLNQLHDKLTAYIKLLNNFLEQGMIDIDHNDSVDWRMQTVKEKVNQLQTFVPVPADIQKHVNAFARRYDQ